MSVIPAAPVAPPDSSGYSRAILNILSDFAEEKDRLEDMQSAVLNILDDAAEEKRYQAGIQSAVLNILEDAAQEKRYQEGMQKAVLNILEDAAAERANLETTQRAVLNILEDFDTERIERAEAEAEVRVLNEELEGRVTQRTAALTAANKELEAFSYSLSHDLRAPLRTIDGFAQALVDDYAPRLDEQGKDYLMRVRSATQRMGQLIDDMLRLSRVTRGDISVIAVDLSALAASVAERVASQNPGKRVALRIAPQAIALGDVGMLNAVFENLFSNAWKFTAKTDHPRVTFSAERQGAEMVCAVADNGAGFDMEYASNLFKPFQRLHRVSEFGGNGVGLATVKRVIERLGGRVWAEGKVGEGATFYFTLLMAA